MADSDSVCMQLKQVLEKQGERSKAVRVTPDATVLAAIQLLVANDARILIVSDTANHSWLGVVTDKQLLKECANHYEALAQTAVRMIMKRDVMIAHPEDKVDAALRIMVNHRIEFLPVVADNQIIGVLSMDDLLRAETEEDQLRIHYLSDYLEGTYGSDVY